MVHFGGRLEPHIISACASMHIIPSSMGGSPASMKPLSFPAGQHTTKYPVFSPWVTTGKNPNGPTNLSLRFRPLRTLTHCGAHPRISTNLVASTPTHLHLVPINRNAVPRHHRNISRQHVFGPEDLTGVNVSSIDHNRVLRL